MLDIRENVSLRNANTLAVSATARYLHDLIDAAKIPLLIAFAAEKTVPFVVLGSGSNIVLTKDYPGLVIRNRLKGIQIDEPLNTTDSDVVLRVEAGELWDDVVNFSLEQGYCGIENLALIPGTMGAAPVQNIGAYGVELSQVFYSLRGWDCREMCWKTLSASDCQFSYRHSIFKSSLKNQFIIVSVNLRLRKDAVVNASYPVLGELLATRGIELASPRQLADAVVDIRNSKLPDPRVLPNAGSFFSNPIVSTEKLEQLLADYPQIVSYALADSESVKLAAGWLVEKAGWKGKRLGNVGIHDKQALVLINYDAATGADIIAFAAQIQQDVARLFDVRLEIEPEVI